MFISANETLLTNDAANLILGEVVGYRDNYLIDAVLRYIALSHNTEIPKRSEYSPLIVNTNNIEGINEYIKEYSENFSVIIIGTNQNVREDLQIDGWVLYDNPKAPVDKFLSKISETTIFINEERRKITAFTKIITERWMDFFLSTLPRLMTWYYPAALTKEDTKVFGYINKDDTKHEFISEINSFASRFNFVEQWMKKALSSYSTSIFDSIKRDLEYSINSVTQNINSLSAQLAEKYKQLERYNANLYALMITPQKNDDALFNYFMERKDYLSLRRVSGQDIIYSVSGELEFYDEEKLTDVIKNKRSYFYTNGTEMVREVMKAVFLENKGRIVVSARFKISSLKHIDPIKNDHIGSSDIGAPHPHITLYGCFGGNLGLIQKALSDGDWDLAIDQTVQSVRNINFADAAVCGSFMTWLKNHSKTPCIKVAETGEIVSIEKFFNLIKKDTNN